MKLRFLPVFELIVGALTGALALLSATVLVVELPGGDFTAKLGWVGLGWAVSTLLAIGHLRTVVLNHVHVDVGERVEIRWPLRRGVAPVVVSEVQTLRANVRATPWEGLRSELQLIVLGSDGRSVEVPVLRRLLPGASFRATTAELLQLLKVDLEVDAKPAHLGRALAALRVPVTLETLATQLLSAEGGWQQNDSAEYPHVREFEGRVWRVRVNDFPEYATVYSLVTDGFELDLDALPSCWQLRAD